MSVLRAGLARYMTPERMDALAAAHVGLVGAGGLGSNCAMMLARSGVGRFTIADFDSVEASNLNRQAYMPSDVGNAKVAALARYLQALNPAIQLCIHTMRVTPENALALFANCSIVVEAVDSAPDKAMLYAVFAPVKALYVTASGLAGLGGEGGARMHIRRPRANVVAVGDFSRGVSDAHPPLAPRVMQAAAMQADAVLAHILSSVEGQGEHHAEQTS